MIVTPAEAKNYLRVDTGAEDAMIEILIKSAQKLCAAVARLNEKHFEASGEVAKMAVLYALGYLYENRAEADMHKLTLTLRSLLFPIRQYSFGGEISTESTATLTFAMFDKDGNLVDSGIKFAGDEEFEKVLEDAGLKE